jgi:GTP 3',8-cyclase
LNMLDSFGRKIEYLRLSVTDKCNLNCSYCKRTVNKDRELITLDEIEKTIRLFSLAGINKVRLTGGEPLVREDIEDIIRICKDRKSVV